MLGSPTLPLGLKARAIAGKLTEQRATDHETDREGGLSLRDRRLLRIRFAFDRSVALAAGDTPETQCNQKDQSRDKRKRRHHAHPLRQVQNGGCGEKPRPGKPEEKRGHHREQECDPAPDRSL